MAKVIDLAMVKAADSLVASALKNNPNVLDRLTLEDIEMAFNEADEKTVLVSIRLPKPLLEKFDEVIRARAFHENKRVTRNSAVVELIEGVVSNADKKENP